MRRSQISVKAFGKVNFTLAVTGKREDGYHTISSLMQSISLYNRVDVKTGEGKITLSCNDKLLPTDEKNTAYKAAKVFFEMSGTADGADILVQKNIPYQAGLGSASADAAGVLFALNRLYGNPLCGDRLCAAALKVGADVPFCLTGGTKLAEGIGEKLTGLQKCPEMFLAIAFPSEGMSTLEAYKKLDALNVSVQPESARAIAALGKTVKEFAECCGNVFELCCPVSKVFYIKRRLSELSAVNALMSGSGTAVYGIFESESLALQAAKALTAEGIHCLTATPCGCGVEIIE